MEYNINYILLYRWNIMIKTFYNYYMVLENYFLIILSLFINKKK